MVGDVSLAFRQTNIFWVAIFPLGLTVLDSFKKTKSQAVKSAQTLLMVGWLEGMLHDSAKPRITELSIFEEYIQVAIDVVTTSLGNIPSLVIDSLPYLGILGLFAAFVAYNGGVVLGMVR